MPKPGEGPRSRAKELRWDLVRKNSTLIAAASFGFLAIAAAAVLLIYFLLGHSAALAVAGGGVVASAWGIWEFIDRESGAKNWSAGAGAEALTAGALSKLEAHEAIHGLKFFGFDVDHVVVGISGVAAVETKWTTRDLDLSAPEKDRRLHDDISAAVRGAKKIETLLRGSARLEIAVRPVLVLWGAGIRDVPGGTTSINGVQILVGRQKQEWLASAFIDMDLDEWDMRAALEALTFREQDQI